MTKRDEERDVFLALMRASARGKGLHLTSDEVDLLASSTLVQEWAYGALANRGEAAEESLGPDDWAKVKL